MIFDALSATFTDLLTGFAGLLLLLAILAPLFYLEVRRERRLPDREPEPETEPAFNWPPRNVGPTAEAHLGKTRLPDRRAA